MNGLLLVMLSWAVMAALSGAAMFHLMLRPKLGRFLGWAWLLYAGIDGTIDLPKAIGTGNHLWMVAELFWVGVAVFATWMFFDDAAARALSGQVLRGLETAQRRLSRC